MKMDFSVGTGRSESVHEAAGIAKAAEESGFSHITYLDVPNGARDVYAAVSHCVLSKGASAKISASPIKELVITDSIEYRFDPLPRNAEIVSVAPLFAQAIRSIHERTSISRLFPG